MNTYKHHRFPPDIISCAVWLYFRFNLSHRDIEDLQAKRDGAAAKRFFKRLLRSHDDSQYANNRVEQSLEPTRVRERGIRKFKSVRQVQRFLGAHAAVSNLFNPGRPLVRAEHYRGLRMSAFTEWERAVA